MLDPATLILFSGACVAPVSYTHLDVYKRQFWHWDDADAPRKALV